jgi:hypothetical protein
VLIVSSRGRLECNGTDADTALQDGAGGGGAGGTVVLDVDTVRGSLVVSARGGRGGMVQSEFACYGPGGGGSGGIIGIPLTADVSLGQNGQAVQQPRDCPGDLSFGASSGSAGYSGSIPVLVDYRLGRPNALVVPSDTTVCSGQFASISVIGAPLVSVEPASLVATSTLKGFETLPLTRDAQFLVTVASGRVGCFSQFFVTVSVQQPDTTGVRVTYDSVACLGDAVEVTVSGMTTLRYELQSSAGLRVLRQSDTTFVVQGSTIGVSTMQIIVTDPQGCNAVLHRSLIVRDTTPVQRLQDVVLCIDSVEIDAGDGYTSYRWSTGALTRRTVVRSAGLYTVEVALPNRCPSITSVNVIPFTSSLVTIEADRRILRGDADTIALRVMDAGGRTIWNTGLSDDTLRVFEEGTYWAFITTPEGCVVATDTVRITRQQNAARLRVDGDTVRYRPGDRFTLPVSIRHEAPASRDVVVELSVITSLTTVVPDPERSLQVSGPGRIDRIADEVNTDLLEVTHRMLVLVPATVQTCTVTIPVIGVLGPDSTSVVVIQVCLPLDDDVVCNRGQNGLVSNQAVCNDGRERLFDSQARSTTIMLDGPGSIRIGGLTEITSVSCTDVLGRIQRLSIDPNIRRAVRLGDAPGLYVWFVEFKNGQRFVYTELSTAR